jgi:hypothetical protein
MYISKPMEIKMSKRKLKICSKCNKRNTYDEICWECKQKIKIQTKIQEKCKQCGKKVEFSSARRTYFEKRGGKLCPECVKKNQIESMTKMNSKRTHEELSEFARKGHKTRSFESRSMATKKQWENIKKDPLKIKKISERLSHRMKKRWENMSETNKEKILRKWLNPEQRSKLNDNFKQLMIKEKIYQGFISECPFCGFVPDEINHELKLIIEVYGDYWHCNPRTYKNPQQYLKRQQKTVKERWEYDRRRLGCFYEKGYCLGKCYKKK